MTSPVVTDQIAEILEAAKTIAVVGLSNSPLRPSYGVAAYLQSHGYDIVPVNPTINGALGKKSCPSLREVTAKVDIVDIFRRSDAVEPIVDEAIARGDVKGNFSAAPNRAARSQTMRQSSLASPGGFTTLR